MVVAESEEPCPSKFTKSFSQVKGKYTMCLAIPLAIFDFFLQMIKWAQGQSAKEIPKKAVSPLMVQVVHACHL